MKILQRATGQVISGTHITTLPKDVPLSDAAVQRYYKLRPDDPLYPQVKNPAKVHRLVLRKENGHYVIVPFNTNAYKFHV